MIARIATSMSMPFLALYLGAHTDMGPGAIGFVVGAGALAATFGGFLGGALSDRYSRRLVMFTSLFAWCGVFVGFALTDNPVVLLLLSLLNGLCRSWFEPVSQVLMADLTEPARRMKVFSMRYLMANVGVAIGPVLGVWLGLGNGGLAFLITGAIYFVYAVTLYIMMISFGIKDIEEGKPEKKVTIADAGRVVVRDTALQMFLLGGIVVGIGYSQLFGNMAPHLDRVFGHGDRMFGYLLTINAITVIALQLPLGWLANKRPPLYAIHAGNVFFAVGLAIGLILRVCHAAAPRAIFSSSLAHAGSSNPSCQHARGRFCRRSRSTPRRPHGASGDERHRHHDERPDRNPRVPAPGRATCGRWSRRARAGDRQPKRPGSGDHVAVRGRDPIVHRVRAGRAQRPQADADDRAVDRRVAGGPHIAVGPDDGHGRERGLQLFVERGA
ncbi:hypothetical protein A9X05_15570, partial [Mycobacterium sp. E3298]